MNSAYNSSLIATNSYFYSVHARFYKPLTFGVSSQLLVNLQTRYALQSRERIHSRSMEDSVFAIEYNPYGNLLIAVSDNGSIYFYDCLRQKPIREYRNCHSDAVNTIKFVSDNLFLTASDDNTCKLWDVRSMGASISSLNAHSNWVKNIAIEPETGSILTSAFDDTVRIWNNFQDNPRSFTLLTAQDLVRTSLSDCGTKLAVSLRSSPAMICVINNFKSSKLIFSRYLDEFLTVSKIFELFKLPTMLPKSTPLSNSMEAYLQLFLKKENSLRFITDYPLLDSRLSENSGLISYDSQLGGTHQSGFCYHYPYLYMLSTFYSLDFHPSGKYLIARQGSTTGWPVGYTCIYQIEDELEDIFALDMSDVGSFYDRINTHRLVQMIPEKISSPDGIIREVSFSPKGDFIITPHQSGVNIYPFNPDSISSFKPNDSSLVSKPQILEEGISCIGHSRPVVTCKMSPTCCQIASGCLGGEVSFYSPKLS